VFGTDDIRIPDDDQGWCRDRGADRPDATIGTDAGTLAALVYEGRGLAEVVRSGELRIEGDWSVVERFVGLFPLPEPAAPAAGA
jgi:ubiquinone biosynthesis protein UbiJ